MTPKYDALLDDIRESDADGVGTGDVVGPASSVDGVPALFNGVTGKLIKQSALTTGSVLFAGVGGILQQDNANLFWDDTNNRLGLGTIVPSTTFMVVGGTTLQKPTKTYTWNAASEPPLNTLRVGTDASTNTSGILIHASDQNPTSGNTYLSIYNGYGTKLFDFSDAGVSVGGTIRWEVSPGFISGDALNLSGTINDYNVFNSETTTKTATVFVDNRVLTTERTTPLVRFSGASGNTPGIADSTGGINAINNGTNRGLAFYSYNGTSFIENVRMLSSGATGIGVTLPTAVLHLKAGSATANTSPIKFTSGVVLTTKEVGVYEYDGNHKITNGNSLRVSVGGSLFDYYTDANNGTTVETDLYSSTLPASTFNGNGDTVTAQYGGIFAGDATSTQRLRAYCGGTLIFDSGATGFGVGTTHWSLSITCVRASATEVRCSATLNTSFASLSAYATSTKVTALTLTNTQILKITGTAAGATGGSNQITAYQGDVDFEPAA